MKRKKKHNKVKSTILEAIQTPVTSNQYYDEIITVRPKDKPSNIYKDTDE